MTQEEFDKAPLLDQILYDETGMLVENHPSIAEAMEKYHQAKLELLGIVDVVGRSEQLKAEDKDLPFADYLEKWYELPRYEKVYDRKDGKGTDTEDEVIKNYKRAFRI